MDFVIFSAITWDDQGGAHRPTQLARALARRGHRCLFVQIPALAQESAQLLVSLSPLYEPTIELTSLVALGLTETELRRAWFGLNNADLEPLARNLDARLARFEQAETHVAIWEIPFVPFVRLFPLLVGRGYRTVYDCIDDFAGMNELGRYFASLPAEQFLARHADLVTALSRPLVDQLRVCAPQARVEWVGDGADLNFRLRGPAPGDLVRGELTLGFWGTLADDFVDATALAQVARVRPNWAFNLIGAYDLDRARPSVADALRDLPNVHLLGKRPHETLRDYLAGLDVCLIPFPDNAFSRGRDPIKVYEYLAGYKPVVALHTPQLTGLPFVSVADSANEFVALIEAARQVQVDRQVVDTFLQANSWDARADQLLKLILEIGLRQDATHLSEGGILLFTRFDDPATLTARTQAYLAHLEQLADERLAYIQELEQHSRKADAYIKKLERMHPLIWLKKLGDRG